MMCRAHFPVFQTRRLSAQVSGAPFGLHLLSVKLLKVGFKPDGYFATMFDIGRLARQGGI